MVKTLYRTAIAVACIAAAGSAAGGTLTNLRDAARQTVLGNPEVLSAFHEYQAAEQHVRVAKGGYLPRVDALAGYGEERIDDPRFDEHEFDRDRVSLALSQMIYDGFATRNEVRKLDHAQRVRYFEVQNASESVSAEVARAYFDVLRQREMVDMSKENYAAHRLIYEQIERRVNAGVSRRVDLEQAYGRLALSESNLLTDVTNLHDVSMRYQRLVGESPAGALDEPQITSGLLPANVSDTLQLAYTESPLMRAVIANSWSVRSEADAAKAAMHPHLDLRARQDVWHDKDDIRGRYEEGVVELVMTYNLYNGGSDRAERKRLLYKADQATDLRAKTCRDIRQEVSIAYNDMQALEEQLVYLDRHQLAIGKAREAYRRQFDIGQRTLLDMLDTENEYYDARRAYVIAKRNHGIAYTRALAAAGKLVGALELGSELHAIELPDDHGEETPDMYAVCPPETDVKPLIDKDAIFRDAINNQGSLQHLMAPTAPATQPLPAQAPLPEGTGAAKPEKPSGW